MNRSLPVLPLLLLACLLPLPLPAGPEHWEKDIIKLEATAKATPHPKGALLFVGSSSIRLWDLKTSFPKQTTINHGFGGSELEDSLFYADRIIIPHAPGIIFLYAGDNDINKGKSAERVIADYQKFVLKIHSSLPDTAIVFLPIKPSLARWKIWPEMNKANLAIRDLTMQNDLLVYLDTASPMFGKSGTPRPDLFQKDGLHLNKKGYQLWGSVVNEWLELRDSKTPSTE